MKLLLLHGPAKIASRKKLVEIKNQYDSSDIIEFDKNFETSQLLGNLLTVSLLHANRLVVLENPTEDLEIKESVLDETITFVIWFDHEVSSKKNILKYIEKNKGQVLFFSEGREVSVFPFLDLLADKNKKAFIEMDKLKKGGFDIYYFLTMSIYLLRNLAVTPKTAPPFVQKKLQQQRHKFDQQTITSLYKKLLKIDFKIKSGLLETSQAEFELVKSFLKVD